MPQEIIAHLRYLRVAPRKVRFVAAALRGLTALEAQEKLAFINKRAAKPLAKLLRSAIANAGHNFQLTPELLKIRRLEVNEGRAFRRLNPRARGRADVIHKRTSHVTIVLEAEKTKKKRLVRKKIQAPEVVLSTEESKKQEEERPGDERSKRGVVQRGLPRPLRRFGAFRPRVFRRKTI